MDADRTFTARWLVPVSSPPLEGGTLTIRGSHIVAVDPRGVRSPDVDLGNVAIIPGLVNAHTHLDLSGARGLTPPTDAEHFTQWLESVIAYRRSRTPEQTQADINAGLAECLRFGTTMIGDISADGSSWDSLRGEAMRAIVFLERIGLTDERQREEDLKTIHFQSLHEDTPTCRKGVSPHAPYSIAGPMFGALAQRGGPLATHLAESPGEVELLAKRSGPFEVFLRKLGIWRPEALASGLEAITRDTCEASPCLLVHANYLPLDTRLAPMQSIVYCPRTHAVFGHSVHPWREFQARGVRVCLGTDSLASNPDLDVLAEARFLHKRDPELPGELLLRLITLDGAAALGWAREAGSLDAGKSADFVAVPLANRNDDVYSLILESEAPRRTMFRGEWR